MTVSPGILVTRPQGQAEELAAAVGTLGYPVYCLPLLALQALPEPRPEHRRLMLELDRYQHIIFISGNAVHFGMPWIKQYWPRLPLTPHWYAIGDATARQLREFGVEAATAGAAMTSEALLALPQLQAIAGQRILIVKGEGGRATLREYLSRRGGVVEELACYRRSCPEFSPGELAARLSQWSIAVILISSGEGLANMLALLSPTETSKFTGITLLVPSDRVAAVARQAGFSSVLTAENASDSAMLRALEKWQPSSGEEE